MKTKTAKVKFPKIINYAVQITEKGFVYTCVTDSGDEWMKLPDGKWVKNFDFTGNLQSLTKDLQTFLKNKENASR